MPLFYLTSSTHPPVHKHAFLPLFLLLFCLLILPDVDSMHFVTFLLLFVKLLQLQTNLC